MSDIIRLLPDSVANQIAAGEVIQRPASAVKELLENSVDAGATSILLVVKDAGRTFIQVTDNGKGMSVTDARMCFERHATSKISEANDLFSIRTMGFRGEAMASIAAVSQVEMKTRRKDDELGTRLVIDSSIVRSQEPCQCATGTQITIRNLFFNIPARKNFLKSNQVEFRHIVDEFTRVALAFPNTAFTLIHNEQEVFRLEGSGRRQRITGLFGASYNERLVPVQEATDFVRLEGYIGKPEFARKTRGEQFFFVNDRFIRSPYLHHAVSEAFEDLLPPDAYPGYFIFLEISPSVIDINIHPTKTEVKFEDERSIYAILRSAVKQSLGKYHITPSLDFERETSFDIPLASREVHPPVIRTDAGYNPFKDKTPTDWSRLYPSPRFEPESSSSASTLEQVLTEDTSAPDVTRPVYLRLHPGMILTAIRSGIIVIDQSRAHERILYERFLQSISENMPQSQQQLFAQTITLDPRDVLMLEELTDTLRAAGFDLDRFGNDSIVVNGIPAGIEEPDLRSLFEKIVENYRREKENPSVAIPELIARELAARLSVSRQKKLQTEEMNNLADELFACSSPYITPGGKPTVITITSGELEKRFQR